MWQGTYDPRYFSLQAVGSHASAEVMAPVLLDLVGPRSVVDVGCGTAAWLAVFKDHGVEEVLGIDGFARGPDLKIEESEFLVRDLARPVEVSRRFDLALCLEVAQDLGPENAEQIVTSLTKLSPLVLFSSALPFQPGTQGRNNQWPSYWASLFEDCGYATTDPLRARCWHDERISYWYAQSMLLFVSKDHAIGHPELIGRLGGVQERPLDLVHPALYLHANAIGMRRALQLFGTAAVSRLRTRPGRRSIR